MVQKLEDILMVSKCCSTGYEVVSSHQHYKVDDVDFTMPTLHMQKLRT